VDFDDLKQRIASSQRAEFGHGTRLEIIHDAERHLGFAFPPSYRWWLEKYGCGYLGGYELQGLLDEPIAGRDPDMVVSGDIVDQARRNARKRLFPSHLLELLSFEGDEVYFFDTTRRSDDGEWPVVLITTESSEPETYASCFAGFLKKQLK
jgi:antitoxin YobK